MEQQNHQTTNDNINTSTNLHQDMNTNTNTNKANGNSNSNISGNNGNINGNGGFLCRQSSTRWTPTTEQIRILKELYYNNGVRSPSAEQIQRISARLRQYGKIEGKNVFYWFQNHKARERQKKRFTSDHHNHNNNNNMMIMQRSNNYASVGNNNIITNTNTIISTSSAWKTHHVDHQYHDQFDDHIDHQHHHQEYQLFHHGSSHIKYPNLSPVVSCGMSSSISSSSAASVVGVNGQMGNIQYGYGGVANKEKAFREYGSSGVNGGSTSQNFGWVGSSDPFSSPYGLFDNKRSNIALDYDTDDHDYHDENHDQIETLPLFPMHGEDCYGNMMMKPNFSDSGAGGYYSGGHVSSGRTSLELSLNSYGHISPNSP